MRKKVLIVEDELLIARDLADIIEEMGYECAGIAKNSTKALSIFRSQNIDLVICDIRIEGELDGIETTKKMMGHKRAPVIYLTAFSDEMTVNRAMENIPSSFLLKPYNQRSLQIAINLAIHNFNQLENPSSQTEFAGRFTQREKEIIQLLAEGNTSRQISDKLFISKQTVDKHRSNIMAKSGCKNTIELIKTYLME